MKREPIWGADVAKMLLHIIPQPTNHFPARIYGSPDALRRLGESLIKASSKGRPQIVGNVMVSDGEGYEIEIFPKNQWEMETVSLPYAQLGQAWDFECNCDRAARPTAPDGKGDAG